jgi:PAS domain S-box-containing protein
MNFLKVSPLRTKIQVILISISLLTCASIFTGFYSYEKSTFNKVYVSNLEFKARLLSPEIKEALDKKDTTSFSLILSELKIQQNIIAAAVYDSGGKIITVYKKRLFNEKFPAYSPKYKLIFADNRLGLFYPVDINTGTVLYLNSNIETHFNRFKSYAVIFLIIAAASIILSFLGAGYLQKNIAMPVVRLSNTIKHILNTDEYFTRVDKLNNDEIGFLSDSFNNFLSRIQKDKDELQKQNEALQAAEMRYRSTLDNLQEGCQIIDNEWRYTYLNDAACMQAGKNREELIGRKITDIYPGAEDSALFYKLKQVINNKTRIKTDQEFKFEDGSTRIFSLVCESIPEGIFVLTEDVTEEKKLRDELYLHKMHLEELVRERTAKLEEANKELESFSYSVSHDLRAPLRHINGFTDLLKKNSGDKFDEKGLHYLEVISESSKQMGVLIDDLLVFSRIGKTPLKITPLDLNKIINNTIVKLSNETNGRDIEWIIKEMPTVNADPILFNLVFQNLIDNSIKYTRTRNKAVIEIGYIKNTNEYVIYIKDNGVGFDMQYYSKLFGVFQRLHSCGEFEGSGIGLANVFRIISRHGGRIWGTGEVDKGATFYFTISAFQNYTGEENE